MNDGVYVTIWEFDAKPGEHAEFENFYGPDGEWVQLFRRSKSFLRTELFRDRNNENHYVTVDYFASKAGYDAFMGEFRQDYEALDRRCDGVSENEREMGCFTSLGASVFRAGA